MCQTQNELFRLILHSVKQKYAKAVKKGSELIYPHQTTPLTLDLLESHLKGDITLGVMLLQPGTNTAKAACIDIDIPRDAPTLKDALELAYKVQRAALTQSLDSYIEFSGNRGFHLWFFASSPLPGKTWISALYFIAELAGFSAKEVFPSHELTEHKCIKLPGGLHLKSNRRAGFIGDNPQWDEEGFPVLPDQGELMASFVQNPPEAIALLKAGGRRQEAEVKESLNTSSPFESPSWENFPADSHPGCIQHLLNFGAPLNRDYNNINLILATYTHNRFIDFDSAVKLAETVANATPDNHPTSKDNEGKISNFKSTYKSADRKNYQWQCSYVLAGIKTRNPDELATRGCLGENCSMWPYNHKPSSGENFSTSGDKPQALNATIWEAITLLVGSGKEIRLSTILTALETSAVNDSSTAATTLDLPSKITPAQELREKEILAYILQNPEGVVEAISLDIPSVGFQSTTTTPIKDYLEELAVFSPCNRETFLSYLELIRDLGIRILAIQKTKEATSDYQDTNKLLAETLNSLITSSQTFLRRAVSEVQTMEFYSPDLMTDLFSQSVSTIPTPSQWLNNTLNGGLAPGKFYVLGAPPGCGKTTFCNWLGDFAASNGTPVLIAAYEMSRLTLWVYSLARLTGINSAFIESKRWLDDTYPEKEELLNNIIKTTEDYHNKIAPRLSILECGVEWTAAKLKGAIAQLRHRLKVASDAPVLVVVDYLQLMLSGEEKLDTSAQETLRVSRIATDLKRLARDTKSAVIGISDITKAAYIQALSTGSLDMSALRDSFKIAHAGDAIALLQTGKITVGKGESAQVMDQLALAAQKYPADKQRLIQQARTTYPLNAATKDTYARLTILKNRGGVLAEPLFVYQKALHRFIPINLPLTGGDDGDGI